MRLAIVAAIILAPLPAVAHDIYTDWKEPTTGISCCHEQDCKPAASRQVDGHWQAMHEGRWIDIPDSAILQFDSPDGRGHLCFRGGVARCFMRPGMMG